MFTQVPDDLELGWCSGGNNGNRRDRMCGIPQNYEHAYQLITLPPKPVFTGYCPFTTELYDSSTYWDQYNFCRGEYSDCAENGVVTYCYQGTCYTGKDDNRCLDKANAYDLGDGGFCNRNNGDFRRDTKCGLKTPLT